MAGRQAKTLNNEQIVAAIQMLRCHRYPTRDTTLFLLSIRAGLRAGEIAKLTWPMLLTSSGDVGASIELRDHAAKKGSGRTVPLHPELRDSLVRLAAIDGASGRVIKSERGEAMRASSVVNWFASFYLKLGYLGCSSHSGRRTFITQAAKLVYRAGGSLRDVQLLAGHKSIEVTQRYIEGDLPAQRRMVAML